MSQWRLDFKLERKGTLKAMTTAGSHFFPGLWQGLPILLAIVIGLLAPLGVIAIILAYIAYRGGEVEVAILLPVCLLGFGGLFILLHNAIYRRLAAVAVGSRFNARTVVEISEKGFTQFAPHSTWTTDWRDVEAVLETRHMLMVVISAITLPVPKSAFASPEDVDEAFAAMQAWHAAAVGPS